MEHLRMRVIEILSQIKNATLSTSGPAGIQARIFPCEAHDLRLYCLVPSISDQLVNLEEDPSVVVSTADCQLRGLGRVLPLSAADEELTLPKFPEATGCVLVEIHPVRLQINRENGWGFSETIDLNVLH